jgi:CRISPR system Cascade subunit CasC
LVVDCQALRENLGDADMVEDCLRGFLHAALAAIPTGKQNGMAAHNPPSYVLAVVRDGGAPVSLANAFLQPARPAEGRDLVDASIAALEHYLGVVGRMGAARGVIQRLSVADRALADVDGVQRAKHVDDLVAATVKAAASAATKERARA